MREDIDLLTDTALVLAVVASDVANFCDHVEHCEPADIDTVRGCAATLRSTALRLGKGFGRDALELYAGRLGMIEARNVLNHPGSFDGASAALAACSWRELQLVQVEHDRTYHPDIIGLPKAEQLRHYALHLAKLAGSTAAVARGDAEEQDWLMRRVADMLLFGIKLATVSGEKLADEFLPDAVGLSQASAAADPR
jgi:hypothetical protein